MQIDQNLKLAYEEQKFGTSKRRINLEEVYKPLVGLMDKSEKIKQEHEDTIKFEEDPSVGLNKLLKLETEDNHPIHPESLYNTTYGLRFVPHSDGDNHHHLPDQENNFMIGNTRVSIYKNQLAIPTIGSTYPITTGLKELLTNDSPNINLVTPDDEKMYKQILSETYAYKRNYDPNGIINHSNTDIYKTYIGPWFRKKNIKIVASPIATTPGQLEGGGFKKVLTNTPLEYVYYNHPEELLDRLVLLWGEIKSGNSNPSLKNELINILEEFKEENLLYT